MDTQYTSMNRRRMVGASAATLAGVALASPFQTMAQDATPVATPITPPDMTDAAYTLELGAFSVLAVSDGAGAGASLLPIFFAGVPEEELEAAFNEAGIGPDEIISQNTLAVIDTGNERVLVDTGSGSGLLMENLRREGIEPGDIDVVILTHAHGDHVGGNVDADGNPAFPNARYVMSKEEWDFWTDQQAVEAALPPGDFREGNLQSVQRNLVSIEDQFDLIGYDEEIVPGIQSIAAQGHTPGHMALRFESDGVLMWALGDAALHPLDLPNPEFVGFPDTEPERMVETRRTLFSRIVDEGGMAYFKHFHPFPSIGQIVADGDVWQWEPIEDEAATPVS